MLIQLLYISKGVVEPESPTLESEISEILSASYRNNQRLGVTGLLLYCGGYFCQLLEGKQAGVDAIYTKIANDPRHANANVLFRRPADWVYLPKFPMGCAGIEREVDPLIADAIEVRGWTELGDIAPVVLYSLLQRVPEVDIVTRDPKLLLSDALDT